MELNMRTIQLLEEAVKYYRDSLAKKRDDIEGAESLVLGIKVGSLDNVLDMLEILREKQ